MATSLGQLYIPVAASMAGFRADVERNAAETGASAGRKMGDLFSSSFVDAGKRLAAGFIGAELILKTVDVLKDSVKAAKEDQLVTEQLTTAIKANAAARADDTTRIEKQAAALAKLGFTDNEVKASLTSLVTATGNLGKALDLQNLATDLARARHISLQEASQQLVQVEAGRYRGLAQLGIQIDSHATKEQALAAIQARVAGQAETFAATAEGAAARRDAAYDKLLETIGSKLLPLETELANLTADKLVPALSKVADVGGSAFGVLGAALEQVLSPLARVVDAYDVFNGVSLENRDALAEAARATVLVQKELDDLDKTYLKGGISTRDYTKKHDELSATLARIKLLTEAARGGNDQYGKGLGDIGGQVVAVTQETEALLEILGRGSDYWRQFTTDAGETGAGLDNVDARARAAAAGLDITGNSAIVTAAKFLTLRDAEAAWARGTRRAADAGLVGPTGLDFTPGAGGPGGVSSAEYYLTQLNTPGYTPPKAKKDRSGASAAKAEAKAIHDEIVKAYEAAQAAGERYLDSVHARKSQQISDAHDVAKARIDADHQAAVDAIESAHKVATEQINSQRRAVDAQLKESRRLNAEPVTAAERAQAAIENQRRLRDLQEALADAQKGTDPKALRAAQEALQSFMAQQNIDALREQQAQADEQAQKEADKAQAQLDGQARAEELLYETRKADEEIVYQARVKEEDDRYKLRQHDEDVRAERAKKTLEEHIKAMENSKAATVALADIETKSYLKRQVDEARAALAAGTGTQQDLTNAIADLNAFLKSIAHHHGGGWVGRHGPELGIVGEKEPEYITPRSRLARMVPDLPYGAPRMTAGISARGGGGSYAGDSTVDRSVHVEVHNPTPEPASTSVRRELQLLAVTGILG